MADLNKLRQVNPHWKPSESYEGIANIHKADEHDGDINPVKKVMAQQIEEEMNPSKYTKDDIEHAKTAIAEKILKHFDDTLFEMICDEMGRRYVFQHENYLTEAGYDVFEDEWFEFFHEHHGDILGAIMKNFTN